MSYARKHCGITIMEDDKDLCPTCELSMKIQETPYYKRYVKYPDEPRPNEPCSDFEHPVRWALVAYWEKARADRAEAALAAFNSLTVESSEGHGDLIPMRPWVPAKAEEPSEEFLTYLKLELVNRCVNAAVEWHDRVYSKDKGARQSLMKAVVEAGEQGLKAVEVKASAGMALDVFLSMLRPDYSPVTIRPTATMRFNIRKPLDPQDQG